MTDNIDNIINDMKKINPKITEEHLDLLYRYILIRLKDDYSFNKMIAQLKQEDINCVINKIF